MVRFLDIVNLQKSLTGLASPFQISYKMSVTSPNTGFSFTLLFFLIRVSQTVPIKSNPAKTPSDTYMNCLMKGDDASKRLTFPAGFCSVNLKQKRTPPFTSFIHINLI